MSFAGCLSFRPLTVALRQTFASSFARLHEYYPQGFVRTDKMVVGSPPLQIGQELWRLLRGGPGPACQRGHTMTDGQIHSLNKSRVQASGETHSLQGAFEICLGPKPHHVRHPNQLTPKVSIFSPGRRSSSLPPATGVRGARGVSLLAMFQNEPLVHRSRDSSHHW